MNKNVQFTENIAERLRKLSKFSMDKNLRPQLENIIKKFGGKLEQYDNFAGLYILDNDNFIISLDKFTSPLRDNFYITKALGDYLLFGNGDKKEYGSFRVDDTNYLSNLFAYSFLTPKDEFLKKSKEFKNSTLLLAAYFQISTDFIEKRQEYLKIISKKHKLIYKKEKIR